MAFSLLFKSFTISNARRFLSARGSLFGISFKGIIVKDSKPEGEFTPLTDDVLLEGEASGHCHRIKGATTFKSTEPPTRENDYFLGYFETKESYMIIHSLRLPQAVFRFGEMPAF